MSARGSNASSRAFWRFAATDGGVEQGAQDAGLATFADDAVGKAVREILQNSLDHHESGLPAVHVEFRLIDLPRDVIGAEDLLPHLDSCVKEMERQGDETAKGRFEHARALLSKPAVSCLSITDSNTTGLTGDNWRELVFIEGAGRVGAKGEGGSYGFGKHAPFNLSALSTVFYSTRYIDRAEKGRVTRLVGKTRLATHNDPDNPAVRLQHIGFYGMHGKGINHPIEGGDMPNEFILSDTGSRVLVAGFDWQRLCPDWFDEVIQSAAKNFFYAIHHQNLSVSVVRTNAPQGERTDFELNNQTLEMAIDRLPARDPARWHYLCIRDETPETTKSSGKIDAMGAMLLWVNANSDAPRRTAHINRKGMLITDARVFDKNPFHPYGGASWPAAWCAVSMTETDAAEAYIRRMEPPAHNELSYKLLSDRAEQDAAKLELQLQREQITEIIKRRINADASKRSANVEELAELFPDLPDLDSEQAVDIEWSKRRERSNADMKANVVLSSEDDGYVEDYRATGTTDDEDVTDDDGIDDEGGEQQKEIRETQERYRTRDYSGDSEALIRASRVMRTSPREITVSLTIPEGAFERAARFVVCPAGEQYVDSSERLPVSSVQANSLVSTSVSDGVVTLRGLPGAQTRLRLTLDEEVRYTGYSVIEVVETEKEA